MSTYILHGKPGWGSALTEAMLHVAGLPYRIEEVDPIKPGPARNRLAALNPLVQVPTLVLPDGQVMTESAAITLRIADLVPQAGLVPAADSPDRGSFLRWLIYLVTAIYPTFTYGDWPDRWLTDPAAQKEFRGKVDALAERQWRQVESVATASPWFLPGGFSALDIYITVMTRWRPRRPWFATNCPKLTAIALKGDVEPRLAPVWARNFPA